VKTPRSARPRSSSSSAARAPFRRRPRRSGDGVVPA
jgi:hypothetical protein